MASPNDNIQQQFTELEYVFQKYFNEHMAPVISAEQRRLRANQVAETHNRSDDGWGGYMDAASPFTTQMVYNATGSWNKKNSDDLIKMIQGRFDKDKAFAHDMEVMIVGWRSLAIRQLGEERYRELSKQSPSGDLATDYVSNRFQGLMMTQLAKYHIPHSGLEYFLHKGIGNTIVGAAASAMNPFSGDTDDELNDMALRLYQPKTGTKVSATLLSAIVDGISIFPGGIKSFATTVVGDVAIKGAVSCVNADGKTFDQVVGEEVFGDEDAVSQQRQKTKKVNPAHSEVVDVMNQNFEHKMNVPAYHPPYSPSRVTQMTKRLQGATTDGLQHLENIQNLCHEFGIKPNAKTSIPSWMKEKSEEECIRLSSTFFAIAAEMKNAGKKEITVSGKKYSYDECCQRAYDYAAAAAAKQEETNTLLHRQQEAEEARQRVQQAKQAQTAASAATQQQQRQQQTMMNSQGQYVSQQQMRSDAVGSWGGLMDQLGLSGFGDIGHNLGYVLAMLPDMLIGMFTGQTKSLKLRDNMFPLAAIFAGMFVKNPILKMMLIGLGGANLLNKAGHEAVENAGVQQRPVRYREYADELLDPRIEKPVMKGNSLVATIDGIPSSIIIDDITADAYYKKKIPLNTLCNAVLRKYDEQQAAISSNYAQRLEDTEEKTLSRGIK